jgi:hypothetical protein
MHNIIAIADVAMSVGVDREPWVTSIITIAGIAISVGVDGEPFSPESVVAHTSITVKHVVWVNILFDLFEAS